MEKRGKKSTDDTDPPSSKVLEYYRLHTQNPHLSTYFSGTFDLPAQDTPIKNTENERAVQGEHSTVNSPTSSITSNRKLEWDNGADIGYSNCTNKLQKSFSFPEVNIKASKTSSGSSNQLVFLNSSSDTESVKKSEGSEKNDIFVKIGKPTAESTPFIKEDAPNEEILIDSTPQIKPKKPPRLSKWLHKENVEIGGGENVNVPQQKVSSNEGFATVSGGKCSESGETCTKEFISCETLKSKGQESQSPKNSKDVKSGFEKVHFICDLKEIDKKPKQSTSLENLSNTTDETVKKWSSELDLTLPQRVKYFNRYRTKKIKSLKIAEPVCVECISTTAFQDGVVQTSSDNASIGIQTTLNNKHGVIFLQHPNKENSNSTDSDLLFSNCNSFEFLYGSAFNKQLSSSSNSTDNKPKILLEEYITKKLHRADVKIDLANISSENSSGDSKNFPLSRVLSSNSKDIDNNLKLLSKLVKSKKYDSKTKEYYLNKIIKKIMSEEESSSVVSEKITPNIRNVDAEKNVEDLAKAKLLCNLPWKPASSKTFEFTEKEMQENKEENDAKVFSNSSTDQENYVLAKESESKSWRDDKTLSEKKLEECKLESSQGDSQNDAVVTFAKRERDHQLNWINKEIEHLNKLRSVLEKKKGEPHFKDITNIKKTTSVYMITTERNETDTPNTQNRDFHIKVDNENDISEIDFHLYSDHKDYKLKEIVTKLKNPEPAEMDPKRTRKKKENVCLCSLMSTTNEMPRHRKKKTTRDCCSPCCREHMKCPKKQPKKDITICKPKCPRKKNVVQEICIPCEVFKNLRSCPYKCPYSDTSRSRSTSPYQYASDETSESLNSHQLKYIRPKSPKGSDHIVPNPTKRRNEGKKAPEKPKEYSDSSVERKSSDTAVRVVEKKGKPMEEEKNGKKSKPMDKDSNSPNKYTERKKLVSDSTTESEIRLENLEDGEVKKRQVENITFQEEWKNKDKNIEKDTIRQKQVKKNDERRLEKEAELDSRKEDYKTKHKKENEELKKSKKSHKDVDGNTSLEKQGNKTVDNSSVKKMEAVNSDKLFDKKLDTKVTDAGVSHTVNVRDLEKTSEKSMELKNSEKSAKSKVAQKQKPNLTQKRLVPSVYDSEYSKADNDNSSGTSNTFYDASATSSQTDGFLQGFTPSDFSNARVISSTVTASTKNPKSNVRRVILEVPLDHKSKSSKNKSNQMPSLKSSVTGERFSSETTTSTTTSSGPCSCCGKFLPLYESNCNMRPNMCHRRFCMTCFPQSQNFNYTYYENPQHSCHCQELTTPDNNPMMAQIRDTLEELQELEQCERYCKCKLNQKKHENKKKPVSYMLTFKHSPDEDEEEEEENKKDRELDEVVVKVPARNAKEFLGKESKKKQKNLKNSRSLQEYLESNKPTFVLAAEERRKYLLELALMREQRCQKYKQLLALTSGIPLVNNGNTRQNPKKHIFTSQEMRRMTAKNYKKLPEVQQKLLENREKQMKKANRMLADIYNKKLQENVLRGQPSLSTSVSVINLM